MSAAPRREPHRPAAHPSRPGGEDSAPPRAAEPAPLPRAAESAAALVAYQRVLDRVYERSRELVETAPTWQAGLYRCMLACYTEMRAEPEVLELHFVATMRDARLLRVRVRHRDRLLGLLARTRDDAPAQLHGEFLLNMIHASMRAQIRAGETPPDLDAAEQTFATILWRGAPVVG